MAEVAEFGARIRELRERSGKTQAGFAELAGVTARAQRNYEAGLRVPNIDYLRMLALADIDIGYILSGFESRWDEKADAHAFNLLTERLGLPFMFQVDLTAAVAAFRHGDIDQKKLTERITSGLAAYRIGVLDSDLLAAILEAIDGLAPSLPSKKKAGIAALLYRAFRASGCVDQKAVKEAVDLAS